jgi:release factor glutamine methyltransferase
MFLDADPPPELVARLRAAGCVFAEEEAALLVAAAGPGELAGLTDRRVAGEPLEQVLGRVEFAGLRIAVAPGVFVPRRRTELLVRLAVEAAGGTGAGAVGAGAVGAGAVVVDLCCGSGAVGAAVAAAVPGIVLHAADVDPAAAACARVNLAAVAGAVHLGDLYEPLPAALRGRVDVLVANAPYVPTDEVALMPAEARLHEPRRALDGGADGLDLARRVVAGARDWLAPGGRLVVETSGRQADALRQACAAAGLEAAVVGAPELDATAVVGRPVPGDAQ